MLPFIGRYGRALADPLIALFVLLTAGVLRAVRDFGIEHLPWTRDAFERGGWMPIRRHYHEPLFHPADLRHPLDEPRILPGLDLRKDEQLRLLKVFDFEEELAAFPLEAYLRRKGGR